MAKEYFLAYHSYLEILTELSDAECGRLFRAALEYSATKKTPDLRGNERFLFATLKVQIDRDSKKYEEKCETNKRNGALGGKTKSERQILADGSERFLNLAVAPKEKEKAKAKENAKTNKKESIANAIPKKKPFGEFKNVLLTEQEFEKLNAEYDAESSGIIEHLSAYIEMKGYKAKSHYLAIKKWVALAYQEQKIRETNLKNQTYGGTKNAGINPANYAKGEICTEFSEGDEPPEGLYD